MEILPDEMMSQIFECLPLADRKSVRLTCRAWHNACISSSIIKREKFVFRSDAGVGDIAQVMLRSNHPLLNLEFQGQPVYDVSESTWEECGERIHELEFQKCHFLDETMKKIILCCENLRCLVVRTLSGGRGPLPYSLPLLNDLIEKGIRRPNLCALSIIGIKKKKYEGILPKIFLLHPCITSLRFVTNPHEYATFGPFPMPAPPILLRLDGCSPINQDSRLQSLAYNVLTDENWTKPLIDEAEEGFRLKHFETKIIHGKSNENTILTFFKSQKNLEVVRLLVQNPRVDGIKDFTLQILESCPKLREFRLYAVWFQYHMHLKSSEMPRFIASISKLQFLCLGFNIDHSEPAYTYHNLLENNVLSNLTSLDWFNTKGNLDFCNVFLQYCPSLQHLRLTRCRDGTLQTIFQYLPELRTLALDHIDLCTDSGFTGRDMCGYSVRRLQRLKYLKLNGNKINVTEKTTMELQFPDLEYLSLHAEFYSRLSEETRNHLASHLPALRVLTIENLYHLCNFTEEMIQFSRQLKNLDRLVFPVAQFDRWWDGQLIENIFHAYKSLKYISNRYNHTYWFHPLLNRALLRDDLKFFSGNIFRENNIFDVHEVF